MKQTEDELLGKYHYFYGFFADQHERVIAALYGHGRKHSIGEDEQFLHHSANYHAWKSLTHLVRGCFKKIDKDSEVPHWTLAQLRLYMAQNRRK